jgi:excisionase family DNA binding protein
MRGTDPDQISNLIDRFCDAGRDLAKAIAHAWLETQAGDQAGAVPIAKTETRSGAVTASDDPLMTAVELGAYLKMSPATVRDWARKGRIPFEPVGRERRFRRSVVDKWIDANKAKQSSPTRNNGVESGRSFLRPQNHRSKSNGRV